MRINIVIETDENLDNLIKSKLEEGAGIRVHVSNLVFQLRSGDEVKEEIKVTEECFK
ncbi:hypothetical protein EYM_04385 [Ignicoccus islandicus DSM 13165]|uniref:Uncharacterized protein n=1 Tax=Ignicoccus islandicus DSM 13165 TaxID=940295 RepID=A0A0U3FRK2_9CREN|nr:hypothetical protein [Ignicoccus islandicus]ALU12487.1 hypothetical protein EYM_04385 [Ignicoccus islandicus DSM 13165]